MTIELLHIVDENNQLTGEQKSIRAVHADGDWHQAVHVWVVNDKGELLLQRRAKDMYIYPDMWDISAAGHVSAGDDELTTAIRECEEEIGLKIAEEDLEYLFTVKQRDEPKLGELYNNEFNHVYLVTTDKPVDAFVFTDGEVEEVRYVHYMQVQEMLRNKENIVKHTEEYSKLFAVLEERFGG